MSRIAAGCMVLAALGVWSGCSESENREAVGSSESALSGEFHELSTTDIEHRVDGDADASVHAQRVGALRYAIDYVADGVRTTVFDNAKHRINPVFEARTYGRTTLVCQNSFADTHGRDPRVECVALEHGKVMNRAAYPNAWLRNLAEDKPLARVSPGEWIVVHGDGKTCRAIGFIDDHTFGADQDTPRHCSEEAPVEAMTNGWTPPVEPSVAPADEAQGMDALAAEANANEPSDAESGGDDGTPSRARCQAPDTQPVTVPWSLSWNFGRTRPDFPRAGLTTGFTVMASTTGSVTTHPSHCLDYDRNASGSISGSLVFGRYGINITGASSTSEASCSTGRCDDEGNFSCGAPSGHRKAKGFSVGGGGQFTIPLDLIPQLKPVCGAKWVSCNIDVSVNGTYGKSEAEAQGKSACGSGCMDLEGNPTGERTSSKSESASVQVGIAGEIEVALGRWANGRGGVSGNGEWALSVAETRGCGGEQTNDVRECWKASMRAYVYGCVGNGWFSYCINRDYPYELKHGQCD